MRSSFVLRPSAGLTTGLAVGLSLGIALAPCVPVHAATTSARALVGPEGDPEALSSEAVERFQAGDYDAAVSLFQQAYAVDPQPNYLFNIGRVYEEKGDLQNAVVYYQKFVGQSGVDLDSRQAATERLKVLREAVAQLESNEPKPKDDDGTEPPQTQDQPPEPTPDEVVAPAEDEDAQKAAKRKKTLRITGYVLMGVGGAALVVGGVLGGLASSNANSANADEFVDRKLAFRNKARRQAAGADAMFITGGVLAVTGVALVLATLGGKKSKSGDVARRTVWSPVVGPEQLGVGLTHRF